MHITHHSALDHLGHLPLSIRLEDNKWYIAIELHHITRPRLSEHLAAMLRLTCESHHTTLTHTATQLYATIDAVGQGTAECCITLNDMTLVSWHYIEETIRESGPYAYKLTVSELRMLGQYPHPQLPYLRSNTPLISAHHSLFTDLHTHLSSQITARGLLEAAAASHAYYPVELLALLDIDTSDMTTHPMPSYRFTPAASDGLACEQAGNTVEGIAVSELIKHTDIMHRLQRAMTVPADSVITFDALERQVYRMRNPLSKHPASIAATILDIARDYAAQGITYAELAVTAALDPEWLDAALPALHAAETETGTSLRLLAAIPRSLPPIATLRQLDIVKFIARHPMIVGIDFLGYESNKTRNFGWALHNIARYAASQAHGIDRTNTGWKFADDFIVRVHAGENGKNPNNVREVLELADTFHIRVRVGHAAYGDLEVNLHLAKRLAQQGLLIIEFNPDSNIAMNNIDHIEQLPIRQWATHSVPFVIASDGAGVYRTDAKQLLASAVFAGIGDHELNALNNTETRHIAYQQSLYQKKHTAFHALYADDHAFTTAMKQHIAMLDSQDVMQRLSNKTPILIAGASGSSWSRISLSTQQSIEDGIRWLVDTLNPEKVYFVLGRVKSEGIGRILDKALNRYFEDAPDATPFDVVGMLSQHQNMPTLTSHINYIMPLSGELMSIPTRMTEQLYACGGCALYIGGSAFTRDFIHCSETIGLPFGVMADAEGASAEKAQVLAEHYIFRGAHGMVAHIRRLLGTDVFNGNH